MSWWFFKQECELKLEGTYISRLAWDSTFFFSAAISLAIWFFLLRGRVSVTFRGLFRAVSHTVWHRVGLSLLAMACTDDTARRTDDSFDLREFARLLLYTHGGGVVFSVRGGSIDSEARTFWWSCEMPRFRSAKTERTADAPVTPALQGLGPQSHF